MSEHKIIFAWMAVLVGWWMGIITALLAEHIREGGR